MTLAEYLALITGTHSDKPKFVATVTAVITPILANLQKIASLPNIFDLDNAVGDQLDIVGKWVGRARFLNVPLTNVFFSFDDAALGFDQGSWFGPFDSTSGIYALPDDAYRTYLRAVIAANHWDGTIPMAYAILDPIFARTGSTIQIYDNGDMTMTIGVMGTPDAATLALLQGGYLALKPSGVRITGYTISSMPLFTLDSTTAGFDQGVWS